MPEFIIPFIIVFGVVWVSGFVSIGVKTIKMFKSKNNIFSKSFDVINQRINTELQKNRPTYCEYCGCKIDNEQSKCESCGATVTKKVD